MPIHHTKTKLRERRKSIYIIFRWFFPGKLPGARWARIVLCTFFVAILAIAGTMYGIALWYTHAQANKPVTLGVSFIPDYAEYLGVDPHDTLDSLVHMGVKHFRFVSYWSDIEATQGTYDFSELDYEMQQASNAGAKVTLAVGLRQPRWPECHAPDWVDTSKPEATWTPQLNKYMTAVVERYKNSSALESYQLENEFYNKFGDCKNFNRSRLNSELALVHKLDAKHPVIITRSDNYAGFSLRKPLPDVVGISVYRRVWDGSLSKRYLQYPFPSWYYAFLAGSQQILTDKPSVLHELQLEAWPPQGQGIKEVSLAEQNKSLDAARMKAAIQFGKQTGLKTIDLWGGEYWYYRMVVLHDPSLWQVARQTFEQK